MAFETFKQALLPSSPQSARDGDFDYYVPGSRERFEVLQF